MDTVAASRVGWALGEPPSHGTLGLAGRLGSGSGCGWPAPVLHAPLPLRLRQRVLSGACAALARRSVLGLRSVVAASRFGRGQNERIRIIAAGPGGRVVWLLALLAMIYV